MRMAIGIVIEGHAENQLAMYKLQNIIRTEIGHLSEGWKRDQSNERNVDRMEFTTKQI